MTLLPVNNRRDLFWNKIKMLGKVEVHYSLEKTFAVIGVGLGTLSESCKRPELCLADMADKVLMALPHVVSVDWCVDIATSPAK